MAEDKDLKLAKEVYKSICAILDGDNWHYEKDEENLIINCGAQGEDLPIPIIIEVDKQRQIVTILSQMPFIVPEKQRTALAIAVSQANNGLVDGNFDYDSLSGRIIFRMTSSYRKSLIGKELFAYMLMCTCFTVDKYNDKFLVVAKNEMSIADILGFIE